MKDLAILALLLSLCYTTSSACDPQSNNQPQCNQINLNIPIRNFWDPTVYWLCKSSQSIAELIKCPDSLLFDPVKRECVPNKKWIWLKPCSATTCDPESNNEPICDGTNLNKPIRNFWDPTAYWMCRKANAAADLVKCPIDHMFDSEKELCIPSSMWIWTEPCPNKINNSIACLRAKAQEHQARLLNSGLFLQVRSFADLQQRHHQQQQQQQQQHALQQQGKSNVSNNFKICDTKSLSVDPQPVNTSGSNNLTVLPPISKREIV